jgi:hypothetical protein
VDIADEASDVSVEAGPSPQPQPVSDPELAAMMEAVTAARRHEMIAAAKMLAGPDGLRIDPDEAAATLTCCTAPRSRTC